MSFIAAISKDELVGSQMIEGAFDATLIENFVYRVLRHVRSDPRTAEKPIVLLMDNAVVHRHTSVIDICQKMRATILFNAQYSPWLNPIEYLFGILKRELRRS
jgi:transposase